eukprot:GHVU01143488.1.p1 GENE.GHVU01143488.1~~GHVU01143488.1.p1  ORF type:complete len:109 (-),score=18.54 GHVU01143488.1:625-951(-)
MTDGSSRCPSIAARGSTAAIRASLSSSSALLLLVLVLVLVLVLLLLLLLLLRIVICDSAVASLRTDLWVLTGVHPKPHQRPNHREWLHYGGLRTRANDGGGGASAQLI